MTRDDFDYALENTHVILAPERQIATFGNTSFNFYLISELMDRVDQVRIRNGKVHAERPQILTPEHYCRLLLEGFGEKAERYVDQLREHARNSAVLRYGTRRCWVVGGHLPKTTRSFGRSLGTRHLPAVPYRRVTVADCERRVRGFRRNREDRSRRVSGKMGRAPLHPRR